MHWIKMTPVHSRHKQPSINEARIITVSSKIKISYRMPLSWLLVYFFNRYQRDTLGRRYLKKIPTYRCLAAQRTSIARLAFSSNIRSPDSLHINFFMSFCPTLSTLCSQVVFHNIPQTAKERDKKYSVKSPQRYKKYGKTPVLFVPLFCHPLWEIFFMFK